MTTSSSSSANNAQPLRPPFTACWLDSEIGEEGKHVQLKARFEGLTNLVKTWTYYDCGDSFTDFLNGNPYVRLIVIISGGFARRLIPLVANNNALHSVYVFCVNVDKAKTALAGEDKVRGIYTTEDEVYNKLKSDLSREFFREGDAWRQLNDHATAGVYFEEAKRLMS